MTETESISYSFRMPRALKDALKADADKNSRSLNQHVTDVLTAYLEGRLIDAERLLSDPAVRRLLRAAIELHSTAKKKR